MQKQSSEGFFNSFMTQAVIIQKPVHSKSMDQLLYDNGLRHERVKKGFMRIFAEFTKKHLCQNLFFDKFKLCRSATLLKSSLQSRYFLAKIVGTPFSQSTTAREIGKQNRKLLKRAVQVKEQVSEAVVRRLQIRCSKNFVSFTKNICVGVSFQKSCWPKCLQLF